LYKDKIKEIKCGAVGDIISGVLISGDIVSVRKIKPICSDWSYWEVVDFVDEAWFRRKSERCFFEYAMLIRESAVRAVKKTEETYRS